VAVLATGLHPLAGQNFTAVLGGSGQDCVEAVASDATGNVYVAGITYSTNFPVTAGALQVKSGGGADAFVAKFSASGTLLWSTYLGGSQDDWAQGVAVDGAGNVLVTGWTRSPDFPLFHQVQTTLNNGASPTDYDAFVTKLDPNGAKLLYSTFLGAAQNDGAFAIAVGSSGSAYVTGQTDSVTGFTGAQNAPAQFGIFVCKLDAQGALIYTFFHPYGNAAGIAVDTSGAAYVTGSTSSANPAATTKMFGPPGNTYAMVFKVSPDGSTKLFETGLGGSVSTNASSIALDSSGAVYVAGSTSSVDFPLLHPIQSTPGARPLWKSTDGGATWSPLDGLPFALPQELLVDPSVSTTLYMATADLGIFKSTDGAATWTPINSGIANPAPTLALAIDPVHPQTLYAATGSTSGPASVYKTVNGGGSWSLIDSTAGTVSELAVDAQDPSTIYEVGPPARKSTDGGANWNAVPFPGTSIVSVTLDPRVAGNLFAISAFFFSGSFGTTSTPAMIYHSTDGGADWTQSTSVPVLTPGLTVDGSTNPSLLYDGLTYRSSDGGLTWPALPASPFTGGANAVAVDPSGILYGYGYPPGIFVSHDHGQTFAATGSPSVGVGVSALIPAGTAGTLYAIIAQVGTSGFVTKLSADGSSMIYSTYLRGHASQEATVQYLSERVEFETSNWIAGIGVDSAGKASVAGGTRSIDLPTVNPFQAANAGLADAFASTLSADGTQLTYSTYLGGSKDDGALAATVDARGNVILAGQTWSEDFPVSDGTNSAAGTYGDAFVARLSPGSAPIITSVVNGANFLSGIEGGSWVTIRGSNMANTNPGRMWRADEIINGALPTSLDGVSVTIDGKPAFVEYISPTQINLQAPSDAAVGAVAVVVNNNDAISGAALAQLQAFAPAFFQFGGTNYALATRWPDNALVADPGAVAGAVPADPGDVIVLWATGFGPTTAPAGQVVTGAPAAPAPTVTVGGVQATVISTVLTPGTVGLYQVAVQIPGNAPAGVVVVQASTGGVQSWAGALLFIN
jgi:uncharacterized protein (TIGR03437 family)